MDKTVRTFKQCRELIKEQQYKHVRLLDLAGNTLVVYNPNHKKTEKVALANKLDEIERRLKSFAPGIYILECRVRFQGNEPTYKCYVGNKNYNPADIDDAPQLPERQPRREEPVADKHKSSTDKLLSVDKALEYATENARLTAENAMLIDKVAKLEKEVTELEAELDAMDAEDEGTSDDGDRMEKFADTLGKILLPVADRYLDLKEKKLENEKIKTLADAGYDITKHVNGAEKKGNNASRGGGRNFNQQVPKPDDADWGEYLDWLGNLSDRRFTKHLELVKQASEEVYNKVCEEFDVSFDDDEQEEEEEKDNN